MNEVKRVSTEEAGELLRAGYRYVDVRSQAEYAGGHPAGADNVPLMLSGPGGMQPNPDFLKVMQALYPKDARLLIGCASGKRSIAAAHKLLELGYADVVEMRPGYAGLRDPFGRVTEPGWAANGLPTELVTEGGSYEELRARLGML
jgi:rhodanese-related sulfurtransferase